MNREEAFTAFDAETKRLLAQVPDTLTRSTKRYHENLISDSMAGARLHLQCIYDKGMALGDDFSAVEQFVSDPSYSLWFLGIHRHLQVCRRCIEDVRRQFPAAGAP